MLYSVKVFDLVNHGILKETSHTDYNDALNTSMELAEIYGCKGLLTHSLNIYNEDKTISIAILEYDDIQN